MIRIEYIVSTGDLLKQEESDSAFHQADHPVTNRVQK